MSELFDPILKAYEAFIAPFLTFGAIGLWLSIHITMQGVKALARKFINGGLVGKLLAIGKYGAPYFLGIVGALSLPIFPGKLPHEVVFGGFILGFAADKAHLIKSRALSVFRARGEAHGMTDERKALFDKVEKILT